MSRIVNWLAVGGLVLAGVFETTAAVGQEVSVLRGKPVGRSVDRIGRLEENSQASDAAPYQLSGSWGNARVLVSSADQSTLDQYLGRRVAVRGHQQRLEDGRTLLVAERVVPLERTVSTAEASAAPVGAGVRRTALQDIVPVPKGARVETRPAETIDLPPGRIPMDGAIQGTPIIVPPGEYELGNYGYDVAGHCPDCGRVPMPYGGQPGCGSGCGSPEWFWVRGEYLLWFYDGMRTPPLVTTSPAGTARASAGVLGEPGTTILFGNERINDEWVSGFRIRGGGWLGEAKRFGIEGEYFWLAEANTNYSATSTGNPILARPFFDMLNGQETAELVAFPNVVQGTVSVDASTQLQSAGLWARINACCADWSQPINQCGARSADGYRLDWVLGYRYMRLNEDLVIRENLTSLDTANPGSFVIRDTFDTENSFHGGEVGTVYELRRGRWMLELLGKLALGNNRQTVRISGETTVNENGFITTDPGGILAQRTNSGTFTRDDFAVIPQLGATVGFQVTPRLRATAGYTFVYFSNVVRPGDQIDLDVNPNLFPPEVNPFVGPERPRFMFRETDFWAQGFNVGADFRF